MFSRIRFIADNVEFSLASGVSGTLAFESGTVGGVAGKPRLKSARIQDLSVNTLQIAGAAVTVPVLTQLGSDYTQSGAVSPSEFTFIEQNIVTKGVAGSNIFIECLSQITGLITAISPSNSFSNLNVRVLVNDAEVLASFLIESRDGSGNHTASNPQRVFMTSIAATGATQTINIKWNVRFSASFAGNTGTFRINAGSRAFAVAMKR
jgi:hypothetical protein